MRKIIAAGCLMIAMSLCMGCSTKKDSSKDTTKATTEAKMKVQSKYKVPKITAAKKTDQLADAQKGETIVTMKVKGYGEMKFKFFMKKAIIVLVGVILGGSGGNVSTVGSGGIDDGHADVVGANIGDLAEVDRINDDHVDVVIVVVVDSGEGIVSGQDDVLVLIQDPIGRELSCSNGVVSGAIQEHGSIGVDVIIGVIDFDGAVGAEQASGIVDAHISGIDVINETGNEDGAVLSIGAVDVLSRIVLHDEGDIVAEQFGEVSLGGVSANGLDSALHHVRDGIGILFLGGVVLDGGQDTGGVVGIEGVILVFQQGVGLVDQSGLGDQLTILGDEGNQKVRLAC